MKVSYELTFGHFCDMFRDVNCSENFSYEGKRALYDWLEEYYDGCDGSWDGDIIALCCEFAEDTWQDIADNYSIDLSACDDEEECINAVRDYLADNTIYVGDGADGSFVYQIF
jgi:hypothetical protein